MIKKVIPKSSNKQFQSNDIYFGALNSSKVASNSNDKKSSFIDKSFTTESRKIDFEVN